MPWAGYLHRIAISDKFIILDEVQFEKNSYTNRNRIKTSSGVTWLTVPVCLKGHISGTIREVKIASGNNGLKKQWKTIQQAYAKSPYFKTHKKFFDTVFEQSWQSLVLLNQTILDYLLIQFEIDTPCLALSEMNTEGKKQDLILALCEKYGANEFIFGAFGRDYVDVKVFNNAGVQPYFHEYNTLPYPQLWGAFEENLSVIDMLFNIHPSELRNHLFASGKAVKAGQN